MKELFSIIFLLIILSSFAHAEEKISRSVNGNIEIWRIDEPNVRQSKTTYEQIKFHQGDFLTFSAGGIVNTGGWGNTCKRYVNPSGEDSDKYYFGLVNVPDYCLFFEQSQIMTRFSDIIGKRIEVGYANCGKIDSNWVGPESVPLVLGYSDDDYADNKYDDFDAGTERQCDYEGPAWVEVRIEHVSCQQQKEAINREVIDLNSKAYNAYRAHKYGEALAYTDEVLSRNKNLIKARTLSHTWLYRGWIYEKMGKLTDAMDCWDRALSLNPNKVEALYSKGKALCKIGQCNEGAKYLDECIALGPHAYDKIARNEREKCQECIKLHHEVIQTAIAEEGVTAIITAGYIQ